MPSFRIPIELRDTFVFIASLDEKKFSKFISFLSSIETVETLDKTRKQINDFAVAQDLFDDELTEDDDLKLDDLVFSLVTLRIKYPDRDIAEDIFGSFATFADNSIEYKSSFLKKVNLIIENSISILFYFKKSILKGTNDNIFNDCDIVTDLRFIFGNNFFEGGKNALIIHRLKIAVEKSSGSEDIHMTLDLESLLELKSKIERAIAKEEKIKEEYSNTISFIN